MILECEDLGPIPKAFCMPLFKSSNVTVLVICVYIVWLSLACLKPFKLHQSLSSRCHWPWPDPLQRKDRVEPRITHLDHSASHEQSIPRPQAP